MVDCSLGFFCRHAQAVNGAGLADLLGGWVAAPGSTWLCGWLFPSRLPSEAVVLMGSIASPWLAAFCPIDTGTEHATSLPAGQEEVPRRSGKLLESVTIAFAGKANRALVERMTPGHTVGMLTAANRASPTPTPAPHCTDEALPVPSSSGVQPQPPGGR